MHGFHIWCEGETWTSNSHWQKETKEGFVSLTTSLNGPENFLRQSHVIKMVLPRGIPSASFNFIPCQEVKKIEEIDLLHLKLGQ